MRTSDFFLSKERENGKKVLKEGKEVLLEKKEWRKTKRTSENSFNQKPLTQKSQAKSGTK